MTNRKAPPKELLQTRPGLVGDENVHHPSMGVRLPKQYTKALHERICQELENGQRPQGACARAGITVATFQDWIRKGKAGDPVLWSFAEDVEIAYNKAEAKAVDVIAARGLTDNPEARSPEEAKWWLSTARADGYSKQVKTVAEGQIIGFLQRLETALEPALFEKVLAVYLGQSPGHQMALPQHVEDNSPQE